MYWSLHTIIYPLSLFSLSLSFSNKKGQKNYVVDVSKRQESHMLRW